MSGASNYSRMYHIKRSYHLNNICTLHLSRSQWPLGRHRRCNPLPLVCWPGMLVWVEKWLSFHVTCHGQIKPGGAQPSPSLVWVQSLLLLDELLDDLPEPVIPQVTRSLKRTWPAVGKTLYSYRPPGGLPMGTAPDSPPEELLTYAGALSLT